MSRGIMLDLETASVRSNAVVISIGACVFDTDGGPIGAKFHHAVGQWDDQAAKGLHISGNTMSWWMGSDASSPNQEARDALFKNQVSPAGALHDFAEFCSMRDLDMWGNGADFDNIILGNMYSAFGIPRPWSYSQNRCFRTMKNLKLPKTFISPARRGVQHNALDDAIYQAEYLQAIYQAKNL